MKTNLMGTAVVRLRFIISARLFSSWSHYDHLIPSSVGETAVDTSVGERADDLKIQPPTTVGSEENIPNSVTVKEENFVAQKKYSWSHYDHLIPSSVGETAVDTSVGESADALKLQRPTTVRSQENMRNSVTVKEGNFVAQKKYSWSHYDHLMPSSVGESAVYTSVGERADVLKIWRSTTDRSQENIRNTVTVKEINFVAQKNVPESCQYIVQTKGSYKANMQKRRNRLHLWQKFFANPSEWWDHRNSKLTPRSSDFKHKDTNEALWIAKNDPSWIKEQLQSYDSRLSQRIDVHHKGSYEEIMQKRRNRLHLWQVFFANPSKWWDHRNSKMTPRSPDFKHKDSDEALWITRNDPPWVNEQLRLYDSRWSKRIDVHHKSSYEEIMHKRWNRHHLWQIFFANPSEWWDNRKSKLTSGCPDFKHKDTNEALWISRNDPPWINKQLQLYDLRMSKWSDVHQNCAWSHLKPLVFD